MSLLKVRTNAFGTMADVWKIGKSGPTFLHGSDEPSDAEGTDGDTYIQIGDEPRLWTKRGGSWLPSGDSRFAFVRQTVTTATAIIGSKINYVGVNRSAGSVLTLSPGSEGRRVIIKDESGNAAASPIVVGGANGQMIDGTASTAITINHGFVDLIFNSDGWRVIGRSVPLVPTMRRSDTFVVTDPQVTSYTFQRAGGTLVLSSEFLMIYLNRNLLRTSEYSVSGNTVTFSVALNVGDEIEAVTLT